VDSGVQSAEQAGMLLAGTRRRYLSAADNLRMVRLSHSNLSGNAITVTTTRAE